MLPLADSPRRLHAPVATAVLILGCALVFVYELTLGAEALEVLMFRFGVVPAGLQAIRAEGGLLAAAVPFVTSLFLHGGWIHVLGNVWTLWIFGDNVEDRMGPLRFVAFYLVCGLVAGGAHVAANPDSVVPAIGASGAIGGVLGAYFLMYPAATVVAVVPIVFYPLLIELPAVTFLGFWFLTQFFSGTLSLGLASETGGGVAWWAHVGGFLAGMLLYRLFLDARRLPRVARRFDSRGFVRRRSPRSW